MKTAVYTSSFYERPSFYFMMYFNSECCLNCCFLLSCTFTGDSFKMKVVDHHFKAALAQRLFLEIRSNATICARLAGPQLEHWSPEDSPLHGPTAAESSPLRFNMRFTDDRPAPSVISTNY